MRLDPVYDQDYVTRNDQITTWFRERNVTIDQWRGGMIVDPKTFAVVMTVFINDDLLAMQFKLTWSEDLITD